MKRPKIWQVFGCKIEAPTSPLDGFIGGFAGKGHITYGTGRHARRKGTLYLF